MRKKLIFVTRSDLRNQTVKRRYSFDYVHTQINPFGIGMLRRKPTYGCVALSSFINSISSVDCVFLETCHLWKCEELDVLFIFLRRILPLARSVYFDCLRCDTTETFVAIAYSVVEMRNAEKKLWDVRYEIKSYFGNIASKCRMFVNWVISCIIGLQ
ncbi:hypothetical protein Tcan_12179 [Toxocara canis]|uniref:Uncharacterized protein n=1 Tax=Toxocara canis TaxID=6265 RepID=A0A0B2UT77_TOXCA|nr:hypothetical protein Tcan_12179 [Toxocara canis]